MTAAEVICPICDGTGWKRVEKHGLSAVERCSCANEAIAEAAFESANIPLNYDRASLDNFEMPRDNPTARSGLGRAQLCARISLGEAPRLAAHR
jgi:DNA replication protein DnaC